MRNETKEKLENFVSDRTREFCAFSLFVIAILLTVSLGTYHGLETNAESNAVGLIGAWVSFFFYQAFGYGFYFLILSCVALAIVVFRSKEWLPLKIIVLRAVMFVVSLVSASVLLYMIRPESVKRLDIPSGGGLIGKAIGGFTTTFFGEAGTSIIFTAILIGALTLLFDKNLASILKFLWFCVCKICSWIVALFRAITAKKLQEELDEEE